MGAAMDNLAFGGNLMELAREDQRAVEAGVEDALLVEIRPFDLDPPQYLVPCLATFLNDFVELLVAELLQILLGLFNTDEGRGYAAVNLGSASRRLEPTWLAWSS